MGRRILFLSDLDFTGSGYLHISIPLCEKLAELGYDIKAVGIGYKGNEHNFPFSIIPVTDIKDAHAAVHNLSILWKPEILIVALDIPQQLFFYNKFSAYSMKYFAITPLENGPLCMSWAANLINMDGVFFISELGMKEAKSSGVIKAEHLIVGVDTESWKPPTNEERAQIRTSMGIEEDEFVIFTNADNQERKNLWAAFKIISETKKLLPKKKIKYVLVTREHSPFGWKLRDLATTLEINENLMVIQRGISFQELWALYAMSDLFLLTSKAEGLGLPILEAMACGVPVVATKTGAITELLEDGRGFLIQPEYEFIDVWGNSKRSMIDTKAAANTISSIIDDKKKRDDVIAKAQQFVSKRSWDFAVQQITTRIEEVCNGK